MSAADIVPGGPAGAKLRRWQRFTPLERIARTGFYLFALLAVLWALRTIEIIPEFLYDAPRADGRSVRAHVADRLVLVSEGRA